MEIFCPNNHLVLTASKCEKCGWQRPVSGKVGKPVWGPVDVLAGLGGESQERIGNFAHMDNTLVMAPRSKELVGVSLLDGRILWRNAVDVGKNVVSITAESGKLFLVLQDTHSLLKGVMPGSIEIIDPEDGHLTPFWTAPSHDLTPPVFWQERIFVRTAESKLYALDVHDPAHVIWDFQLSTWWAAELVIAGDTIAVVDGRAMFNEGQLIGLDAATGSTLWQHPLDGIPSRPMCTDEGHIYLLNGKRTMISVDARTGKDIWTKQVTKVYNPPQVFEGHIFFVMRGNSDETAPDHYVLVSLDAASGDVEWQQPFPSHLWSRVYCSESSLLTAGSDGVLRAFNITNGHPLWEYTLGHDEDPLQTHVYPFGNMVVIGTYFGQLAAVTIKEPKEQCPSPEICMAQGEWQSAAEGYALQEEWVKAADLYANKLMQSERAMQLYEKAGDFKAAANLASKNKVYSVALENFRKANDLTGQAETMYAMGDKDSAAKIFYETGNPSRAAEIYLEIGENEAASRIFHEQGEPLRAAKLLEEGGKYRLAAQYFKEAGKLGEYIRLILKTPLDIPEVERLRAAGDFETAARWEMDNQKYADAAQDFRKAGKNSEELNALKLYQEQAKDATEQWAWLRIAELGEGQGDLVSAGNAWLKVDRPEYAAKAYLSLADALAAANTRVIESIPARIRTEIATRYQQAADIYKEAGLKTEEEQCKLRARIYNQEPKVIILQAESSNGFREMEWNQLTLRVQNIGYGRAIDVTFNIGEERFEVDDQSLIPKFNLFSGRTYPPQVLKLRPLKDQYGETVPLEIKWSWKSASNKEYSDRGSVPVKVVARLDPQSTGGPVTINVASVENLATGAMAIDKSTHRTENSNIAINRGMGTEGNKKISLQTDSSNILDQNHGMSAGNPISKICPNCTREISTLAKYCPYCNNRLTDD